MALAGARGLYPCADMLRAAATGGAQVRSAARGALEAGVDDLGGTRPRALVLLRRPGTSGAAAAVLNALLGSACPVPVVVADAVPSWIGPLDVVVAHTDDGTDFELADSVGRAVRRGAEVVLSAPADGPVASAGAGRMRLVEPRIPVPAGLDLPRALAEPYVAEGKLFQLDAPVYTRKKNLIVNDAAARRWTWFAPLVATMTAPET